MNKVLSSSFLNERAICYVSTYTVIRNNTVIV